MKRPLSLVALSFALCAFPASAILDTNENGMSDLWEKTYNDGELYPSTDFPCGPQDDMDCDGWTNEMEAAADTDPFDPNAPDGLLRPDIVHIPEVPGESPELVTISWPTIPGKQYTLLYSPDLIDWLPVPDETFPGNGSLVEYNFTLAEADKLFCRVTIEDVDSDGDGLTDAEEALLGTNSHNAQTIPGIPDFWLATHFATILLNGGPNAINRSVGVNPLYPTDSDSDGLSDDVEAVLGTSPVLADSDGDGTSDGADEFPLDPSRNSMDEPDPNDTTPPTVTLDSPANALEVSGP